MRFFVSSLMLIAVAGCVLEGDVFESQPTDGGSAERDGGEPIDVALTGVTAFAARFRNTVVVANGQLWASGDNMFGQLGDTALGSSSRFVRIGTDDDWVDVTGGDDFLCGIRSSQLAYCWGANDVGQLGTGDFAPRTEPTPVVGLGPVRYLGASRVHACAVKTDGTLWCWGANGETQLGQTGDRDPKSTPVQVGTESDWRMVSPAQGHTCGIREPGTLWCWGRNSNGESGQDPAAGVQLVRPTQFGGRNDWVMVAAGQQYTCAIDGFSKIYCWGDNTFGQMGVDGFPGSHMPTRVGIEEDWIDLTVDTFATCGLHQGSRLECWGRNDEGQLGISGGDRTTPTIVTTASTAATARVSAGRFHTCLLDAEGVVACTGENVDGRLGVGDFFRRDRFVPALRNTR